MRCPSLTSLFIPLLTVGCPGVDDKADPAGAPESEIPDDGFDHTGSESNYYDRDGDGYAWSGRGDGTDCDDNDSTIHPGAEDLCDGVDQDCDGELDEDGERPTWYLDADYDGSGDAGATVEACEEPEGYVAAGGDCDDGEPLVKVGGLELCGDGLDNDCEGTVDSACADTADCDITVMSGSSLQDAIDAASSGDTLCVGPGVWSGTITISDAPVIVRSLAGSDETFLQRVSFTASEGSSMLQGFTLSGGIYEYYGGCVAIQSASATLVDLVVEGCTATYGAGIFVEDGSLTLVRSVLRSNTASEPGWAGTDKAYGDGGAINLWSSAAVLAEVTLEANHAENSGGGLNMGGSTAALRQVEILDNSTAWFWYVGGNGGGGLRVIDGRVTLENVLIARNTCGWPEYGGGVSALESEITLTNVTLADNNAPYAGGGGLSVLDESMATLTNTVVVGNAAAYWGGGVLVDDDSTLTITYSDVWGNDPEDFYWDTDPIGSDGNLAVDPGFLDDMYHLSATSPLVDAGDPDLLDPDGTRSDMGAWGGPGADD